MKTELTVVMFTDQVASTAATRIRTHAETLLVVADLAELTTRIATRCRGSVRQDTGDGALISFASCSDAVACGFLIQQYVKARNARTSNPHLQFTLHIGIDFGELAVGPDNNIRGDAANTAARVCSKCPGGDVWFTSKVNSELSPREFSVAKVGSFRFKGLSPLSIYRLAKWEGSSNLPPDSFLWRRGITDGSEFFDREKEQRALQLYVRGRQNCQILGPRKIGKTSLLRQVQRCIAQWQPGTTLAFLDSQDPRCFTLSGWLREASRQLNFPRAPKTLADFAERSGLLLVNGSGVVVCLDEFEELRHRDQEFTRDFFLTLRSLGQRGMTILTASQVGLNELTDPGDPSSPFYNTFPALRLGPFSNENAEDFVTLYRAGVLAFTPEQRKVILEFARGNPLALQVACFHVSDAKNSGETLQVAMQRVVEEMQNYQRPGTHW